MIHSCCRSHLVPSTLLQQPPQTQSHTKVTYILAQIPLQQFQGHFGFPREGKSHRNFIVEDGTQATWQFGGVEDGGQQISAPPPPCSTPAIPPGVPVPTASPSSAPPGIFSSTFFGQRPWRVFSCSVLVSRKLGNARTCPTPQESRAP